MMYTVGIPVMNLVMFAVKLLLIKGLSVCECSQYELQLTRSLLADYNPKARPVTEDQQAVNMTVDFALHNIMQVNEKSEFLKLNIWTKQYWNDPRLRWNKTQYGTDRITLEPRQIWLPDITLYNSATSDFSIIGPESRLIVQYTGDITWHNPTILISACSFDITLFPFDDQLCKIRLGSWTFSKKLLDLKPVNASTADLSRYAGHGEWILQSVIPHRSGAIYDCCEGEFIEISYEIKLRRRTLYYIMNFFLPCILIAVLTLLVFLLPFESGERMSYGVTVLLSFTVLILMLQNKLPPTSKVIPLIGVYYACTIIEVSLAMITACLIMRVYCPEQPATLPHWAKTIVMKVFAKVVGLSRSVERVKQEVVIQTLRRERLREHRLTANPKMSILTNSILKKEEAEAMAEEWRLSAFILNRLFALIYLITIIVTLVLVVLVQ